MKKFNLILSAFAFVFAVTFALASEFTKSETQTSGYYFDQSTQCVSGTIDSGWNCSTSASGATCKINTVDAYEQSGTCGDEDYLLKKM